MPSWSSPHPSLLQTQNVTPSHAHRNPFVYVKEVTPNCKKECMWNKIYSNKPLSPHVIRHKYNNAYLRDLTAATGLVILFKLDSNQRFFSLCDLEIWWMTPKNNPAPLLCYFKLFASFRSHWWIQTGVTVRKRPIWVNINDFLSRVTFKH